MPQPNLNPHTRFSAAFALSGGIRVLVWACGHLSRLMLARTIVAVVIVIVSLTLATYALWIGAILWMATGRFGILRSYRRRAEIEGAVALASIVLLVALSASQGRPAANLVLVAACALGGGFLWFNRAEAWQALRAEVPGPLRRQEAAADLGIRGKG